MTNAQLIEKYDIRVVFDPPPIPTDAVYVAWSQDDPEMGSEYAATPGEAVRLLVERIEDRDCECVFSGDRADASGCRLHGGVR
jgi:hypothetical protein